MGVKRVRNRWGILAVLFAVRATMAFQFQSVAAVAPLLSSEYGVGLADVGVLIGLYFAPGVALALPGGAIGQRFGDKTTVVAALLLMLAGSVAMASATKSTLTTSTRSRERSGNTGNPARNTNVTLKDSEITAINTRLAELDAESASLLKRLSESQTPMASDSRAVALPSVTAESRGLEKIALFRRLFSGRQDVFPLRWENPKTGRSGYSPFSRATIC